MLIHSIYRIQAFALIELVQAWRNYSQIRKITKRTNAENLCPFTFWSSNNPSMCLAYLKGTFNNSFMLEHSYLFWDSIPGHELYRIQFSVPFNIRDLWKSPAAKIRHMKTKTCPSYAAQMTERHRSSQLPHSTSGLKGFIISISIILVLWPRCWFSAHTNKQWDKGTIYFFARVYANV